eukprot:snap_masked-scaffold_3-processed-gene-13.32-mRNA-1 protein AED:1.00 eAED:1.00 QI:0/-1/0/0/-1/1/1/0/81
MKYLGAALNTSELDEEAVSDKIKKAEKDLNQLSYLLKSTIWNKKTERGSSCHYHSYLYYITARTGTSPSPSRRDSTNFQKI